MNLSNGEHLVVGLNASNHTLVNDSGLMAPTTGWLHTSLHESHLSPWQQILFLWIPCLITWICSPFWFSMLKRKKYSIIEFDWQMIIKNFVVASLIVNQVVYLVYTIIHTDTTTSTVHAVNSYTLDLVSSGILIATFCLALVLLNVEKSRGLPSSGLLFLFFLLLTLSSIYQIFLRVAYFIKIERMNADLDFVVFCIFCSLVYVMLIMIAIPQSHEYPDGRQKGQYMPLNTASIFSRFTFWWLTKQVLTGARRELTLDDMWETSTADKSAVCVEAVERVWNKLEADYIREKRKQSSHVGSSKDQNETDEFLKSGKKIDAIKPPSMYACFIKVYGRRLLFISFLQLVREFAIFAAPVILGRLIKFVKKGDQPLSVGIFLVVTLFLNGLLQGMAFNQYFARALTIGVRMRLSLMNLVYKKSLRLSNSSRKESTVGQMVNLIAINAQSFNELPHHFNMFWSSLLAMVVSLTMLWFQLGPASLAGIGVLFVLIPITAFLSGKSKQLQQNKLKFQDSRIKTINELLNGIKVVKLYAWELSFEKVINAIRNSELKVLRVISILNGSSMFSLSLSPFLVAVGSFGCFMLFNKDEPLSAERAFVSLSLFNTLRLPLFMLPLTISNLIQGYISMKRITSFLLNDEIDLNEITRVESEDADIKLEDCSFGWSAEVPLLKNLNFEARRGQLSAVVGSVGSGKSSLMNALIGEMYKLSGYINIKGKVAYAPQQPWIQNASIRNNILFGLPYDRAFYQRVVTLCCLRSDFEQLVDGDMTEIGEKGINLSGGQKQRISLARCVYSNADVYLLDDTLSAVDSHVGKKLFDDVIGPKGILKDKTRIFVTNALNFLPQTTSISVISDGEIKAAGTYDGLMSSNDLFKDFVQKFLESIEHKDTEEYLVPEKVTRSFSRKDSKEVEFSRQKSLISSGTLSSRSDEAEARKLVQKEAVQIGDVKLSTFATYFKACNAYLIGLFFILAAIAALMQIVTGFLLSRMSDKSKITTGHHTTTRLSDFGMYALAGLFGCVFTFCGDFLFIKLYVDAARKLHKILLGSILKFGMSFFESTPIGRILNRFAKDVESVETKIPEFFKQCISISFATISILLIICINTPLFMAALVPIFLLFFVVQRYYVRYSRQMKRLESVSRSPIYAFFGESLNGISTIRAFRSENRFIGQMQKHLDDNTRIYYSDVYGNRWLTVRLEVVGLLVVFCASMLSVLGRDTITPGTAGLTISSSLSISFYLSVMVRFFTEFESNIVSVERINEYCELPTEADWEIKETEPAKDWPSRGAIQFENYSVKYREDLDFVIKDVNCSIKAGEKIGIIGRTGAGKSTMTLALFRILESNNGRILIDGVDIKQIGLHTLRKQLTIIPQDPVLFSGTIRSNLDPFNQYSDERIWASLESANLKDFVMSTDKKLEFECSEGGDNLSVGQRQLICLARALLKKTKILILDEATAAIDHNTDSIIQSTIREKFNDCTVLTIAHRLNTIMDSTRIMVMDKGQIKEFDSPQSLLADKRSQFYSMAKESGLIN